METLFHLGTPPAEVGNQMVAAGISLVAIEDPSLTARSGKIMEALEAKNVDSRKLVVVAESRPADALNTSLMNSRDGVSPVFTASYNKPEGKAEELAKSWASEIKLSKVLGPNTVITTNYTAALNSAISVPRAAVPELHIVDVSSAEAGISVVTFVPFTGASKYQVFDLAGNKSYDGAAPRFTLPAQDSTFKLKALNSAGAVMAERDLRISQSSSDTGLESRVGVSTEASKSRLSWAETAGNPRPRTILRSEAKKNADGSSELLPPVVVARTCGTGFTDTAHVVGKEYVYETIQTGTVNNNICATLTPSREVRESAQVLTSVRTPALGSTANALSSPGPVSDTATPTSVEAELLSATRAGSSAPQALAAPLPWRFRYQTFIAGQYVRPASWDTQVFDGNNRGFGAWIDRYKSRVDTDFTFNSIGQISGVEFDKRIGTTHEYHCPTGSFNNCSFVKSAIASSNGIGTVGTTGVGNPNAFRAGRITHNVAIPIKPHGVLWGAAPTPSISYEVDYVWTRYGFNIVGWHDGAPSHEIWGGYIPGHYIPIMTHSQNCGFAQGLSGLCSININIKV